MRFMRAIDICDVWIPFARLLGFLAEGKIPRTYSIFRWYISLFYQVRFLFDFEKRVFFCFCSILLIYSWYVHTYLHFFPHVLNSYLQPAYDTSIPRNIGFTWPYEVCIFLIEGEKIWPLWKSGVQIITAAKSNDIPAYLSSTLQYPKK